MKLADTQVGQFGGRVNRQLNAGGGRLARGELLTPEQCLTWPLRNRIALRNTGQVEFFSAPAGAVIQTEMDRKNADRMAHVRAGREAKRARLLAETNEKVI
jgi:hypothetical protein